MIDHISARRLAIAYLDARFPGTAGEWDVLDEDTAETDDGWTFYWNAAEYVRTRDEGLLCYGAIPVWVSKTGVEVELRDEPEEH